MEKKTKTLFIIDGSSVIYRAFHAIPPTLTNSAGTPTNATYGFTQTLKKILTEWKPDFIGVAFDSKGPGIRHEKYVDYKSERPPMPDDLSVQIPYIKRIVEAFNIPALEVPAYEADDIMATIDKFMEGTGVKVVLITGDKDMYQLIDEDTVILDYNTGSEFGPVEVEEKFGVGPSLIRDLIALAGDTSDNIPGVPGVGPKTAAKLLKEFGSFDGVYENIDKVSGKKLKENLDKFKDQAELSKELATLHYDVPVKIDMEALKETGPDVEQLTGLFKELGFTRMLTELSAGSGERTAVECEVVTSEESLTDAVEKARSAGRFSLTIGTKDGSGAKGFLAWVSLGLSEEKGLFIPVEPVESEEAEREGKLVEDVIFESLKGLVEDPGVKILTDDSKAFYVYFEGGGANPPGVDFDTSIASYLINPSKPKHTIEALSLELLGETCNEPGTGKREKTQPTLDEIAAYASTKACNILVLAKKLEKTLEDDELTKLYREIELPLAEILARMELRGIKVDTETLMELSREMARELEKLEADIYRAAGEEFNINSPKQLSNVLFEKLGLKPLKKTKTGFSTDEEVLTKLAASHEVPQLIISYRQMAKLKSTYVDALIEIVNPATGRVHTSFNQTVTATGRLSSSSPNLQNIPVRSEAATRIRSAFVAEKGCVLLSADYSQIELRIVAHLSGDPTLIESFLNDEDIHTRTASEIFNVPAGLVTPELRRRAKAINFGIIYGMGPYGLSTELGISMAEAMDYIESYFAHYDKVKEFIDHTVEDARERGYTTTIFGRRRYIPELSSPVESAQRFGIRVATNTPVQGSAADIIKAAMININRRLVDFESKMLLQIHDELVFEVPEGELDAMKMLVKKEMEGVKKLKVPIKVNMTTGPNWSKVG